MRATASEFFGSELSGIVLGLAAGLPIVMVATVAIIAFVDPPAQAVLACDQAVSVLLNTKDALELERAHILIDELNCSVAKRLPA